MQRETHKKRRKHPLVLIGRLAVAAGCLAVVVIAVGPSAILSQLAHVSAPAVLGALALQALIVFVLAWRWMAAIRGVGLPLPYLGALRLTFVGTTLNMVLPTGVGGDVGRIWLVRRYGVDLGRGAAAAIYDRAVGLTGLAIAVALPTILLPSLYPAATRWLLVVPLAAVAAGLVALWLTPRLIRRIAPLNNGEIGGSGIVEGTRTLMRQPLLLSSTVAVSVACHLTSAVIAVVVARGMGFDLSLLLGICLFPPVILATLVPISIGGWGVRELAAIPLLHHAGMSADLATAVALIFGLTQLVAAALGAAFLTFIGAGEPQV